MNILIPMAGQGIRFAEAGYLQHKPLIPTTNRNTGFIVPMVVAAVSDLPPCKKTIFVVRDFHSKSNTASEIAYHISNAEFFVANKLTEGQASSCLLAKKLIDSSDPLLISACDNGIDWDYRKFANLTLETDAIIFTFKGNDSVEEKPEAYGWVVCNGSDATGVSIKKPISSTPINDNAIVGTFWFKHGKDFVYFAEQMIIANDRINNEFYVDQVFHHMIHSGRKVKILEVDRYFCWGTPQDYENYEKTINYWKNFLIQERMK